MHRYSATDLGLAAYVWAWVEPQQGKRTDLDEKSSKLTVDGFVSLDIRGLTTKDTVRKYRKLWQAATRPKTRDAEERHAPM